VEATDWNGIIVVRIENVPPPGLHGTHPFPETVTWSFRKDIMANPPASSKGTASTPGANGKTDKSAARSGPYDPQPGAAVKGKGRTGGATITAGAETQARRAERRPELIKTRREELRRMPAKRQRERLYTRAGLAAVAVLLVGAIGFSIYQWGQDNDLNQTISGIAHYSYPGGQHDDNFSAWTESPPVGGYHNNVWQNCGFYDKPVGSGNAVHSLEHGAVWITYKPDLPQDQIDKLKSIAESQDYILVSPYENQSSPIVVTAWDNQLQLQSADDKDLARFVHQFKGRAGEAPEAGAACSGGTSRRGAPDREC
jgi:hypothetical protein